MGIEHEPEMQTEFPISYEGFTLKETADVLMKHSEWLVRGGWREFANA